MENSELKLMAAMIAGGLVRDHGASNAAIAKKGIAIAREIQSQVDGTDADAIADVHPSLRDRIVEEKEPAA